MGTAQSSLCQADMHLTSKGMLEIWLDTMDATSSAPKIPVLRKYSVLLVPKTILLTKGKLLANQALYGYPTSHQIMCKHNSIFGSPWTPLVCSWFWWSMCTMSKNANMKTKMPIVKKVWWIAVVLVCKPHKFAITPLQRDFCLCSEFYSNRCQISATKNTMQL